MEILEGVYEFIAKGGWLAILLLVVFSGHFGFWVFGWVYKKLEAACVQKDEQVVYWRDKYLGLVDVVRTSVEVGEKLAPPAPQRRGR